MVTVAVMTRISSPLVGSGLGTNWTRVIGLGNCGEWKRQRRRPLSVSKKDSAEAKMAVLLNGEVGGDSSGLPNPPTGLLSGAARTTISLSSSPRATGGPLGLSWPSTLGPSRRV